MCTSRTPEPPWLRARDASRFSVLNLAGLWVNSETINEMKARQRWTPALVWAGVAESLHVCLKHGRTLSSGIWPGVAGVSSLGGPRLVVFVLAVGLRPAAHPLVEGWERVPVPFFECVGAEGLTGAATQIGEHCDLVGEVRVLGPAVRDHPGDVPHVFVVQPGDNSIEPPPKLNPQIRIHARGRVPGPRQDSRTAQCLLLFIAAV